MEVPIVKRALMAAAGAMPIVAIANAAFAHTGVGTTAGFPAGFLHPVLGVDHVLVMIAVGVWAAGIGGRAIWLVPATFVATMAASATLAMSGVTLPAVEFGIVTSVIVLGGLIAFSVRAPVAIGMVIVGLFALFHGHAHGAEMPVDASGLAYGLGFVLATTLLHAAGVGVGLLAGKALSGRLVRLGGGAISATGVALLLFG